MSNLISVLGQAVIDIDSVESIQQFGKFVRVTFHSGRTVEFKDVPFEDFLANLIGNEEEQ